MTTGLRHFVSAALVVAALVLHAAVAAADDIRVMTSGAFTAAYLELAAEFERRTGHTVITEATSMGVGDTSIPARLARGEAIDVVIIASDALDRLIVDGHIRSGTRVDLARSSIGMAVRRGAPKPDISTVAALTRTLREARSIAYSASVSGTYLSTELLQRLGIADEVLPKSRRIDTERVGAVVARGEAELGFQQLSELHPIAGIDVVGPLPAEVQRVTVFAAGIGTAAAHPEPARELVEFLAAPEAAPVIRKTALEPVSRPLP
jgi:molybdate transport system substrate-binding protein